MAKYFKKASQEELEHAQKFMEFQNKRGGKVVLQDIKKPAQDEWGTALDGMKTAQTLERQVNQALLDLHATADRHNDYQVCSIITFCLCKSLQEHTRSFQHAVSVDM